MTCAFGSWRHPTAVFLEASCTRLSLLRQSCQWTKRRRRDALTVLKQIMLFVLACYSRATLHCKTCAKLDQARERCREADLNIYVTGHEMDQSQSPVNYNLVTCAGYSDCTFRHIYLRCRGNHTMRECPEQRTATLTTFGKPEASSRGQDHGR